MNENPPATLTPAERTLREMLWRVHASDADGHFAYGDDGEMQCSSREDGYCDFLRDDAEKIREHIERRGMRILGQIMAQAQVAVGEAIKPASPEPEASKRACEVFRCGVFCANCGVPWSEHGLRGLPWSQHGGRDGK